MSGWDVAGIVVLVLLAIVVVSSIIESIRVGRMVEQARARQMEERAAKLRAALERRSAKEAKLPFGHNGP